MSNDLWRTPPEIVNYIQNRFGTIQLDLCASDENKVADFHLDEKDNFFDDYWIGCSMVNYGELCWLNPP